MVVITLVFFITSFLAATFSNIDANNINTPTTSNSNSQQHTSTTTTTTPTDVRCIAVRTGEDKVFGECRYS
jgi:hypothetical protein